MELVDGREGVGGRSTYCERGPALYVRQWTGPGDSAQYRGHDGQGMVSTRMAGELC